MNDIKNLPTLPAPAEFNMIKEMANLAIQSKLLPSSIQTPAQAIIIALKGRELGIPPMQAYSHISVINGKPTMSAELMLAMIYKNVPGSIVDIIETTSQKCVIESQRPKGKRTTFSFTIDDAQKAGLLTKDPWKKYPAAMLRARVISITARALFPDALNGVSYTPEELDADVDFSEDGTQVVREVKSEIVSQDRPKFTGFQKEAINQAADALEEAIKPEWKMRQDHFSVLVGAMNAARWTRDRLTQYILDKYKKKSTELTEKEFEEIHDSLMEIAKGIRELDGEF